MIQIEKNVPMPPEMRTKYPWVFMEIGDSFAYPRSLGNAKSMAKLVSSKYKKQFTARRVDGVIRIWRTA